MSQQGTRRRLAVALAGLAAILAIGVGWGFHEAHGRGVGLGTSLFSTGSCPGGALTDSTTSFSRIAPATCRMTGSLGGVNVLNQVVTSGQCYAVDFTNYLPAHAQDAFVSVFLGMVSTAASLTGPVSFYYTGHTDSGCTQSLAVPNPQILNQLTFYAPATAAAADIQTAKAAATLTISGNRSVYVKPIIVSAPANTEFSILWTLYGYRD